MLDTVKNSLIIVKNNPFLTLSFVIYLIVLVLISHRFATAQSDSLVFLFLVALLLISAGFLSGWFGMVKVSIKNLKKTHINEEADIENISVPKNVFFESVGEYFVPVSTMFVLYCVLFAVLIKGGEEIATKLIGSIDFLKNALNTVPPEQMADYLKNLDPDKITIFGGWNLFFSAIIGLFGFLTIFWPAAIYYGKNNTKNPFLALWYSATAIFKKPLGVIGLNLFIATLYVLLSVIALFSLNTITAFIHMVFTVFTSVFIVVLIFNYYEQNLRPQETKINSGDRSDSIREKQAGA